MYFIVEVQGCLPYINIVLAERSGDPMSFDKHGEAEAYASENCAWQWQIVEF